MAIRAPRGGARIDVSDPLHELAATIWADNKPRTHDCPNCDRLYRTIERILAREQIENGTPPEPASSEPPQYEPVPEALEWLAIKHPDLVWLLELPQHERDWCHQHLLNEYGLIGHYQQRTVNGHPLPAVTPSEWRLIFDPTLYRRQEQPSA